MRQNYQNELIIIISKGDSEINISNVSSSSGFEQSQKNTLEQKEIWLIWTPTFQY